ncbi:MAG: GAF domain-containing protein, partial [Chloroflexi bacterium]|nr:GAF domain-containing protein [Chloroflexota bacterium]
SLMLLNGNDELTIHSAVGLPPDVVANTRQRADQGIAGYAIKHREPVILQGDVRCDPRFRTLERGEQVKSAICLPLIRQDNVLGVLNISRTREDAPFTEGDVELLSVLGSQAAIALDNARLFREIEQAYQRLTELDYLKSEFLSIAAHELRSPLAVILAYAAILEDEATGPIREHLIQVVEAAMQLKSIIDDMVSLRQIDTGEAQVKLADVNIATTIQEVLANTGILAKRKGQRITVDVPDSLPLAHTDAEILYLILSSLISNAVKFTPEGGAIHIAAQSEGNRLVIQVTDTGIGIPEDELENIFQRFYQVADSLRRQYGGIGLGLAIAREMANLIGGRIWAESQVEQGSTFYLSLPQA